MSGANFVVLFVPIVTGYLTSFLVGGVQEEAGSIVVARPPKWAFGVVWPVLYLALGVSWVLSTLRVNHLDQLDMFATAERRLWVDISYGTLVAFLCSWLVFYTNGPGTSEENKRYSVWVLVATMAVLLFAFVVSLGRSTPAAALLTPMISWILFATTLSIVELQSTAGPIQLNP